MNALAPIVYRAPRIRAWRAPDTGSSGLALAAQVFGLPVPTRRRGVSSRWLLRGGGRRILVVTIHKARRYRR